jgi:hypothetical protein
MTTMYSPDQYHESLNSQAINEALTVDKIPSKVRRGRQNQL